MLGTVALWGRVIEHRLGYRGRLGYPQRCRLICPECFWREAAVAARPAFVAVQPGGHAIALCAEHLDVARDCGISLDELKPAAEVERSILATYAVDLLPHSAGTGLIAQALPAAG